ncbi:hypothetical protein TELCIR_08026 [Teladorsagia circumcincta]|uniref:Uncharacterized protein n=1 Tax=Teladorsagia circumcincta TaxID=45464 RepID=A0A2G9UIQ1_TELCI|nr:hypothetical protein TELCIR_08026 [Teladorsagia circumcincta]
MEVEYVRIQGGRTVPREAKPPHCYREDVREVIEVNDFPRASHPITFKEVEVMCFRRLLSGVILLVVCAFKRYECYHPQQLSTLRLTSSTGVNTSAASMGRKKIQITRIQDERNRQRALFHVLYVAQFIEADLLQQDTALINQSTQRDIDAPRAKLELRGLSVMSCWLKLDDMRDKPLYSLEGVQAKATNDQTAITQTSMTRDGHTFPDCLPHQLLANTNHMS